MNPPLNFSRLILPLALLTQAVMAGAQSAAMHTAQSAPARTATAASARPAAAAPKAAPVTRSRAARPAHAAPSQGEPHHEMSGSGGGSPSGYVGKGDGITTCPVSGDPIDPKLSAVINGRKVYFCCDECIEAAKAQPERYLKSDSGVAVEPVEATAPAATAPAPEAAAGHCAEPATNADSLIPQDTAACPAAAPAAQPAPAAAH